MERMGSERFSEVLGLQEIDSDTDHQGNIQILYKTKEKDDLYDSSEKNLTLLEYEAEQLDKDHPGYFENAVKMLNGSV